MTEEIESNARKATSKTKNKSGNSAQAANTVTNGLAALSLGIPQSRLLLLPLEVRLRIYAYLLDTKHVRSTRDLHYRSRVQDGFLRLRADPPPFSICTAILRVNKQIHHEAIDNFYRSNMFVRLSMYNDDIEWTESLLGETQLSFVCSNPDLVANVKGHALDVRLIQEKSKILRCQVIFPAIFLQVFVDFLQTMCDTVPKWGKEHAIHLYMRQRYRNGPMAAENVLLEPWRRLHGIQSVAVGSALVAPDYANGLRTAMMSQFNPQRWLQSVVKMKDDGIQELSRGQSQSAIDTCMWSPNPPNSVKPSTDCAIKPSSTSHNASSQISQSRPSQERLVSTDYGKTPFFPLSAPSPFARTKEPI
ncbi:MAG: hypothetical protein Q9183_003655 [Haloplaca sp. 2 TL-2023]